MNAPCSNRWKIIRHAVIRRSRTREPTIQRQGPDRILIQVPGKSVQRRAEGDHRHHPRSLNLYPWSTAREMKTLAPGLGNFPVA